MPSFAQRFCWPGKEIRCERAHRAVVVLVRRGGAIPNAVECFEKALALDTEYALACAGLADSYTVLGYYGLSRPETCMPKGIEAARAPWLLIHRSPKRTPPWRWRL